MELFMHYLTLPWLWQGLVFTLQLTLLGFGGGLILGLLLAALQLTRFKFLTAIGRTYSVIYRGTPLILQFVFVFTVLPHMGITLEPLAAGAVALAMNEATFIAEIFRSGIKGIDPGQVMASRALGLRPSTLMRRVIAPQAIRHMVPALGNEAVSTMKNSAIASIIAVPELTMRTQQLASSTFDYFEIYFATAVMYLTLTALLTVIQLLIEDALNLDRANSRSLVSRFFRRPGKPSGVTSVTDASSTVVNIDLLASTIEGTAAHASTQSRIIGEPVIEILDLHKSYGAHEVLAGINLTVRAGEVVALLGPSGSGKSTLLRTINQLETINSGAVLLDGKPMGRGDNGALLSESRLADQRRKVGVSMVFQQFNLFHHLTAKENITGPLTWVSGLSKEEISARADELIAQVGMTERASVLPRHLSGGQQQRIGIARALASQPRVLLLDEPTSALDPELVAEVLEVIRNLAHTHGLTMIIATHQLRFARDVADRVVFMANGVVIEEGPAAEVITNPQHPLTIRFVNAMEAAEV
jgi:polar amino acid transport system permease protein